ncbi:V/A-type H+-transporting ATPase subunit I [Lachnospiraceae bacterium PM6-15]|uniref:V-type ATP synthase subunit I n=1 Tax=Ohessyouella blattaphilus TaxID=2949333 RepID=UPI003E1F3FD8
MIVKMKFLSISGPRTDIDRVSDTYLSKYEMQLENAVTELRTTDNLMPFVDVNPYRDALQKAEKLVEHLSVPGTEDETIKTELTVDEMLDLIREINHDSLELQEKQELLKKDRDSLKEKRDVLEPFKSLDMNLHQVLNLEYFKVRFGRIAIDYYQKLEKYLYNDLHAIFLEGMRNDSYVYGCYFVSNSEVGKVDSVFSSLHFEKIGLDDHYDDTPTESYKKLDDEIQAAETKIDELDNQMQGLVDNHREELLATQNRLEELSNNFDVRKMAARVKNNEEDHYIICGWMGEKDVEHFLKDIENDDRVFAVVEEDREKFYGKPPTKLKNPKLFKPFEMFIKMYGMPDEKEMDPTIFVALTYTLIFGAMFGDVGQGALLFIIGGILYLTKKMNLAGIISIAGLFSMFFGFMFGSVFGFENIIHAKWMRPVEAMTKLPFVGQLNTIFIIAIAFGMALNLLVMVFQIINSIRAKDTENIWFSPNGIAGFIFYGMIIVTVVLFFTGHKTPGNVLLAIFLGIPILVFIFKEPLTNLVERNHKKIEEGKIMFFVQAFFEIFETMLSYFSNTLSYVRIGAFAVSHAAIMEVVLMLAGADKGQISWPVIIIGNIIVIGIEGLIVGIQVLRLEYYEMFSRFYKGTGREFKPFNKKNKVK